MSLSNRAQSSFEMMLTALVVIVLSAVVLSSWFSISDESLALILFRLETNSLLNKTLKPYHITNANAHISNNSLQINSTITPDFVAENPQLSNNFSNIACNILQKTNFNSITLKINNREYFC